MQNCDRKIRCKNVMQKHDTKSENWKVKNEKWKVKCEMSRSTCAKNYFSENCQIGNRKIMGEALSYEVYSYIIYFVKQLPVNILRSQIATSKKCHLAKILRSKTFFGFLFFSEKCKLWDKITSHRIIGLGNGKSWANQKLKTKK